MKPHGTKQCPPVLAKIRGDDSLIDSKRIERIAELKDRIVSQFDAGDWALLEMSLGNAGKSISSHSRLLRSLHWGDDDYPSCVAEVLGSILRSEPEALDVIESILSKKSVHEKQASANDLADDTYYVANPDVELDTSLVSVMMPFQASFSDVLATISGACSAVGLTVKTANDVWESSVLIRDIFDLIAKSCIVVVDFTGKNPNVMYETGIAHALQKEVIPITQRLEDVPFDLKHHRVLVYENNVEGRSKLRSGVERRVRTIMERHNWLTPWG